VRLRGDGTVVDEYRTLVNPERPIPPFITALTSITWEMVRDAPRFATWRRRRARARRRRVRRAQRRVRLALRRRGAGPRRVPLTGAHAVHGALARKLVPELRSRSLDSLTHFFNIPNEARHRAWGDARRDGRAVPPAARPAGRAGGHALGELQQLLARAPRRKRRRRTPHRCPRP
jgi:DNA polymerase III subunit epsilon